MSDDTLLARALRVARVDPAALAGAFRYGSRVYGSDRPGSDHDLILLVRDGRNGEEIRNGDLNLHLWTPEHFAEQLAAHKITALECHFLPPAMVLHPPQRRDFVLDRARLRSELSAKASHSWAKAHKKIAVETDVLVGKKSLFHAIRILEFGRQIAAGGRIADLGAANAVLDALLAGPDDWESIKPVWQPRYNAAASAFRQVAPKE